MPTKKPTKADLLNQQNIRLIESLKTHALAIDALKQELQQTRDENGGLADRVRTLAVEKDRWEALYHSERDSRLQAEHATRELSNQLDVAGAEAIGKDRVISASRATLSLLLIRFAAGSGLIKDGDGTHGNPNETGLVLDILTGHFNG